MTRAAFLILIASLAASSSAADDWTRFRGPNGTGVAEGRFVDTVSVKDFAWKVDLPGKGHASPVIWKGKLYTTSADVDEGQRFVLCLDAADGKIVWKKAYDFSKSRQHADNSFASATPAVDDAGLYVTWATPEKYVLLALTHAGDELWRQDLGPFKSQHGHGASPVVVGDAVIVVDDQEGPQSGVRAFDRRTGKPLWRLDRPSTDKTAMSTPALWHPKVGPPNQLIVTTKGYGFTSLDPATGRVLWEAKGLDARAVGSPVMTDDLVIGNCGDGTNYKLLVAIRPGDIKKADIKAEAKGDAEQPAADPKPVYSFKKTAAYVTTPLVKGDRLFMWNDAGTVTCAEAATGKEIWSGQAGNMYYGSPVCAGDTLWCMSRRGDLMGVSAVGDAFKVVAKVPLGEPSHATPAVADGKMYLRTVSHLICVNVAKKD